MTTPIPEAAVEAAARFLFWHPDNTFDEVPEDHRDRVMAMERALEILTAARPLMEAEIRGQVAADCRVEAENVDLEVPNAYREGTRDGYLSAATIAERTNDERESKRLAWR